MKSTFSVIFYLKRQAVKKDGTVPVMGRITVDGISLFCKSISDIRCRSRTRIDAIKPISTIKIKYPTNTLYRKFI